MFSGPINNMCSTQFQYTSLDINRSKYKGDSPAKSKTLGTQRSPEVPYPQGVKKVFQPNFFWYIPHELEVFSNSLQWFRLYQSVQYQIQIWVFLTDLEMFVDPVVLIMWVRCTSILHDHSCGECTQPAFVHAHHNGWLIWMIGKFSTSIIQSFSTDYNWL